MFEKITNWLVARKQAVDIEKFEAGYGWACTELLHYKREPVSGGFDRDSFDVGVDNARRDIYELRGPVS